MDPHRQRCRKLACRAYGRAGQGHVVIHRRAERRYQGKRCRRTFVRPAATGLDRRRAGRDEVVVVLTVLAYGCPVRPIVAAVVNAAYAERLHATFGARLGAPLTSP